MRACVHAYDKRRVRLAHIIIHTLYMFLHIVHHKDFRYAQRRTSSPRGMIINAHPAAHSVVDDNADNKNYLDVSMSLYIVGKDTHGIFRD